MWKIQQMLVLILFFQFRFQIAMLQNFIQIVNIFNQIQSIKLTLRLQHFNLKSIKQQSTKLRSLECQPRTINYPINPTLIYLFSQLDDNWYGQAYGMTLYKGINIDNWMILRNTMQPETILDLNIQEKIQSNITIDYSEYQFIAKLGDMYNWDQNDPYIVENSLVFNSSQFIFIKDSALKHIYTIEFRFNVSQTFTSDIILLNYTFPDYQLYISLNQPLSLNIQINGINQVFGLFRAEVIHFAVGILHNLEKTSNFYSICFIQFDDNGLIQYLNDCYNDPLLVSPIAFKSGNGDLFIGSHSNSFNQNEYFRLLHFRLYQGFFFDQSGIIDPKFQFFLNDRCIFCKNGFILQVNHKCEPSCDSTQFLTTFVNSHQQCLRVCHPICATCTIENPNVCLLCNGNRLSPPICKCSLGYFEDRAQPNCFKYYQEIQTQSGFIDLDCIPTVQYLNVIFYRPYYQTPSISLIQIGVQTREDSDSDIMLTIVGVSAQNFFNLILVVQIKCLFNFNGLVQQGVIVLMILLIIIKGILILIFQFLHLRQLTILYLLDFQIYKAFINLIIFCIYKQIKFLKLQIKLVLQDKSMEQMKFNLTLYFINTQTILIQLLNQIKFKNQFYQLTQFRGYIQLIKIILKLYRHQEPRVKQNCQIVIMEMGVLLFATQQCYNQFDSCDFYESYITSCSLEYSLCQCNEIGYFVNSSNQCQKCSQNFKTCQELNTKSTSCDQNLYLNITSNQCSSCHHSCQTCTGFTTTECLTCVQDRYLINNNECKCLPGFYQNGNICDKCDKTCNECLRYSECISCSKKRTLDIKTNSCHCPEGQFEMNKQCLSKQYNIFYFLLQSNLFNM